jgi:Zn-dependent protease with chaperone function
MLLETVFAFFKSPLHFSLLIISWAFALISFLYWNEHPKARYLYAHLFFLLVPLLDFAFAVPCQMPFFQGLLSFCSVVVTRAVLYAIPVALVLAVLIGYRVAPALYKRRYGARQLHNKRFNKLARAAGVNASFFSLDSAKPFAFSIGKDVLLSVGMFELLNRNEQDAVVLHELGHVKQKSSFGKFSTALARWFSPLAHFASVGKRINAEERAADAFAVRMQGTRKHLTAAKQKAQGHHSERL